MKTDLFNKILKAYGGKRWLFETDKFEKVYDENGKYTKTFVGRGPMSRQTAHLMIKRSGRKIGRPDIHCHTLRHTWATLALPILGLPKTSCYLAHSDTSTTARFYLHGEPEAVEISAVNTINGF